MGPLFFFVLVFCVCSVSASDIDLKCTNPREVPDCPEACPPQRLCNSYKMAIPCAPLQGPCRPQCVCEDGYARNVEGICVTFAQCDQCPGFHESFTCNGPYDEHCAGSCVCYDGYIRDANNTCVSTSPPPVIASPPPPHTGPVYPPISTGPANPPTSSEPGDTNETDQTDTGLKCTNPHEVPDCPTDCPAQRTCRNYNIALPCLPPTGPCTLQCVCEDGYARNLDGICITLAQCDQCPGYTQSFKCLGPYDEHCEGTCVCDDGYERNANNTCVSTSPPPVIASPPPPPTGPVNPPISTGPANPPTSSEPGDTNGTNQTDTGLKCTNPHEVPDCLFACPPQRTCRNYKIALPCIPPRPPCKPQCVCEDGYARNLDGICITLAQCDQCPGYTQSFKCVGPYDEHCEGTCVCDDGYERNANNTCVSTSPPPVIASPPPPPTGPVNPPISTGPVNPPISYKPNPPICTGTMGPSNIIVDPLTGDTDETNPTGETLLTAQTNPTG